MDSSLLVHFQDWNLYDFRLLGSPSEKLDAAQRERKRGLTSRLQHILRNYAPEIYDSLVSKELEISRFLISLFSGVKDFLLVQVSNPDEETSKESTPSTNSDEVSDVLTGAAPYEIYIKRLDGVTKVLEVDPTMTLRVVKDEVERLFEVDTDEIEVELAFKGEQLKGDHMTLRELGVGKEASLMFIGRENLFNDYGFHKPGAEITVEIISPTDLFVTGTIWNSGDEDLDEIPKLGIIHVTEGEVVVKIEDEDGERLAILDTRGSFAVMDRANFEVLLANNELKGFVFDQYDNWEEFRQDIIEKVYVLPNFVGTIRLINWSDEDAAKVNVPSGTQVEILNDRLVRDFFRTYQESM